MEAFERGAQPTVRIDGPYGKVMIAAFRVAMGLAAGWQSPARYFGGPPGESYEGLVEVGAARGSGTPPGGRPFDAGPT